MILWAERSRRGLLQLAQQCFNASLSEVSVAGGVARSLPWFYSLIAAKAGMKLGLPPSKTLPVLIKVRCILIIMCPARIPLVVMVSGC